MDWSHFSDDFWNNFDQLQDQHQNEEWDWDSETNYPEEYTATEKTKDRMTNTKNETTNTETEVSTISSVDLNNFIIKGLTTVVTTAIGYTMQKGLSFLMNRNK